MPTILSSRHVVAGPSQTPPAYSFARQPRSPSHRDAWALSSNSAAPATPSYAKDTCGWTFPRSTRESQSHSTDSTGPTILSNPFPGDAVDSHPKRIVLGTERRGATENANVSMANPSIFLGLQSPGPVAYTPNYESIQAKPSRWTMSGRWRERYNATTDRVGPGSYAIPSALGRQPDSRYRSLPVPKMSAHDRFPVRQRVDEDCPFDASTLEEGPVRSMTAGSFPKAARGSLSAETHTQRFDSRPVPSLPVVHDILRWSS